MQWILQKNEGLFSVKSQFPVFDTFNLLLPAKATVTNKHDAFGSFNYAAILAMRTIYCAVSEFLHLPVTSHAGQPRIFRLCRALSSVPAQRIHPKN